MDLSVITIILQLVFLECVLSIDNAAVLGAMVAPLSPDQPVPWPARLRSLLDPLNRVLGMQQAAALKVGLIGAYLGRLSMLLLASLIIQNVWLQALGALYLVYLAVKYFGETAEGVDGPDEQRLAGVRNSDFWRIVLMIELADLAFSLDNVVAAVALSNRLWVVMVGIAIGMVLMRFAATLFTWLITWEPMLEAAAYLLLLAIGGKLLLEEYAHIAIGEWAQFAISIAIILLVVLFARVKVLQPLRSVFRPFLVLCVLVNRAVSAMFGLLATPFQRSNANVR